MKRVIESLQTYFSQFGKVDACTIMRDAAGRSRGFAFLTFEDPAAVNAVMVREHFLDGKTVSSIYPYIPTRLYSKHIVWYMLFLSRSIPNALFPVSNINVLKNSLWAVLLRL